MTTQLRRALSVIILVIMAVTAAYSANTFGLRDRFEPPAASSR